MAKNIVSAEACGCATGMSDILDTTASFSIIIEQRSELRQYLKYKDHLYTKLQIIILINSIKTETQQNVKPEIALKYRKLFQ
ncbi:TPA: hypothetical protein IBX06_003760 [Escherichia coli]|uniref:hypothetical protein n=1 Tax=Escherichia coli TaxID=562 RepID=UPI001982B879|nr:hypothetical protein [Escherichia coli]HAM4810537.1 hypothetical protein [Escherichia coli]HAM4817720.1 hypothetical protein [Escherichia coli]HAM4820506.1 hypothetical protein [Escherichia coli]HAM4839572.1 hypothetical protein [Escherichia coli]HAM4860671.1 hypothetical protein [Escherichia coli]